MPRISGTYQPTAGQPVNNGDVIDAPVFNTLVSDLGNEITNSIARDGSSPPTANIPMGNFKITGMQSGTNPKDAATFDQIQDISVKANLTGASFTGGINLKRATVAATATTTPIWDSANGNIQDLTGTPTITDFPDAPQAGASRILYPATGTVITNNANLIVQGGSGYTTQAGDEVIVTAKTVSTFSIFVNKFTGYATEAYANFVGLAAKGIVSYSVTATISPSAMRKVNYAVSATPITLTLPSFLLLVQNEIFAFTNLGVAPVTLTTTAPSLIYARGEASSSIVVNNGDSIGLIFDGTNFVQVWAHFKPQKTASVTPVSISAGTAYSVLHGLGRIPASISLEYVCVTAEQGYIAGQIVQVKSQWDGTNIRPLSPWYDVANAGISCISTYWPCLTHRTAGAFFTPTAANWSYRFVSA